jgi:hypothetical protein
MTLARAHTRRDVDAAYVYGVAWADDAGRIRDGVEGAELSVVAHDRVAALVGTVDASQLRARRRDLLRHSGVLSSAATIGTVVPLAFGTVFDDDEDVVRSFLEPRHDELVELLERLDGRVELTVHASYREEDVLHEIVRDDPRVARLRARGETTLELGEAVARALAARRVADAEAIVAALEPLAVDAVVEELVGELDVVRAAFLVRAADVPAFDSKMDDLARREHPLEFEYVGPLPAYHFARLADGSR